MSMISLSLLPHPLSLAHPTFLSSIYMSRTPHLFLSSIYLVPLNHLALSHHSSWSLLLFLSFTKAMNKFNKSQVLVLFVIVLLLVITPLLPSSLRPTYLYFICNFLIIALSAEAGLLSVFSGPLEDRKQYASVAQKRVMPPEAIAEKKQASSTTGGSVVSEHVGKKPKVVEKSATEKVVYVTKADKVQKCPSMSSLFFIEADTEVMNEDFEAEDEIGGVNEQELFAKAEAFIGNFYKQLKMQREESWIYQKAF